jgi:hypothetical protein
MKDKSLFPFLCKKSCYDIYRQTDDLLNDYLSLFGIY